MDQLSLTELSATLEQTADQFKKAGWAEVTPAPSLPTLASALAGTNGSMSDLGLASSSKNGTPAALGLSISGGVITPARSTKRDFVLEVRFTDDA